MSSSHSNNYTLIYHILAHSPAIMCAQIVVYSFQFILFYVLIMIINLLTSTLSQY